MIRLMSRFAVRRPVVVVVLWVAVLGLGFGIGSGVFSRLVGDIGQVPGSESEQGARRLAQAAPQPETVTAVVTGRPADDPGVAAAVAKLRAMPGVAEVAGPWPSPATGEALLVQVALAPGEEQEETAEAVAEVLRGMEPASVTVSGGPLMDAEFDRQAQQDVARAETLSMPVVLVLLLLVFGGLLAAGLPLLIAVVGVAGTFGVLYVFSQVSDVSVYAIQVTTMIAVGLGVDYALLIVNRFREERRTTDDVPEAILRTTATAGRTVAFSGLTVAVALAGLVVFPDVFLGSMGLAGAAVVLVDMVAALTLLPALLALFGRRIKPAKDRRGVGVFARIAGAVQRRPVLTLLVTGGAMALIAAPVLDLRISTGDPLMLPTSTQTRQMWDDLAVHFPEETAPDEIRVVAMTAADDPRLEALRGQIIALPAVTRVEVWDAAPAVTVLEATVDAPVHAPETLETVTAVRNLATPFESYVTGDAAMLVDYRDMLARRLPVAAALVTLGTLLLLFLFTGSVLLPVKAVLTNLLSIGAALGAVVWVFQQGHLASLIGAEGLGYVHLTVPVLVAAIAFGLSVDYEVFLLSRIRERWLAGADPAVAVADGLQRTGRIVTAAALLIAVVFAGFLVGGFTPIKAIGLGLVLAVALDATLVRMLLVPATMTLLGRFNWWLPGPLRALHGRLGLSEAPASVARDAEPEPALALR